MDEGRPQNPALPSFARLSDTAPHTLSATAAPVDASPTANAPIISRMTVKYVILNQLSRASQQHSKPFSVGSFHVYQWQS